MMICSDVPVASTKRSAAKTAPSFIHDAASQQLQRCTSIASNVLYQDARDNEKRGLRPYLLSRIVQVHLVVPGGTGKPQDMAGGAWCAGG